MVFAPKAKDKIASIFLSSGWVVNRCSLWLNFAI